MWKISLALLILLASNLNAEAVRLQRNGSSLHLSGRIISGDEIVIQNALEDKSITLLDLNIPGGKVSTTIQIAKIVRNANITTMVDAARSSCNSACGPIFVAGTKRIYLHSNLVREGIGGKNDLGLGFHQSTDAQASNLMEQIFEELGTPAGAELTRRAGNTEMYFISGQTAIATGIATTLTGR